MCSLEIIQNSVKTFYTGKKIICYNRPRGQAVDSKRLDAVQHVHKSLSLW